MSQKLHYTKIETDTKIDEVRRDFFAGINGFIQIDTTLEALNLLKDGYYEPATEGIYNNSLEAKEGYFTKFKKEGTTWTKSEIKMPMQDLTEIEAKVKSNEEKVDEYIENNRVVIGNLYSAKKASDKGNWVNYLSGYLQPSSDNANISNIRRSDFIKVKSNTIYNRLFGFDKIIGNVGTVFYDKSKNYISYTFDKVFTTPENTEFLILNIPNEDYLNERLLLGSVSYPQKRNLEVGKNLFDIKTISSVNRWVNWQNGVMESYPTNQYIQYFHFSAPIEILPNTTYSRKYGNNGSSFFDSNMKYISGVNTNTFTTPNNAKYVVLNTTAEYLFEQLELGSKQTSYAKYGELNPIKYRLNLPKKIYAVKGVEANVYLDNLMIDDAINYNWNVDCNVGKQQNERFSVVPADTSTQSIVIDVFEKGDDLYDLATRSISSLVIASETAGSGQTKNFLQIGDSTTFQMMELGCLQEVFNGDGLVINQLGTQGVAPNKNEGHPSKSTDFIFSDASSPFVFNGNFNFSQYMSVNNYSSVDYVTLAFGINDMYGMGRDLQAVLKINDAMTKYDAMISSIKAFNPNIKIGVLIPILPTYNQDAFIFASAQHRWRQKRNMQLWARELIDRYSDRESENIYVVPYATSLDTQNNFTESSSAVNSRNPKVVNRQDNSLHPAKSGYLQMADSIRAWLKNVL